MLRERGTKRLATGTRGESGEGVDRLEREETWRLWTSKSKSMQHVARGCGLYAAFRLD